MKSPKFNIFTKLGYFDTCSCWLSPLCWNHQWVTGTKTLTSFLVIKMSSTFTEGWEGLFKHQQDWLAPKTDLYKTNNTYTTDLFVSVMPCRFISEPIYWSTFISIGIIYNWQIIKCWCHQRSTVLTPSYVDGEGIRGQRDPQRLHYLQLTESTVLTPLKVSMVLVGQWSIYRVW